MIVVHVLFAVAFICASTVLLGSLAQWVRKGNQLAARATAGQE